MSDQPLQHRLRTFGARGGEGDDMLGRRLQALLAEPAARIDELEALVEELRDQSNMG